MMNKEQKDELLPSAGIAAMRCYKQPGLELWNEDCQIGMKSIEDDSLNCILTDPPYLYLKNQKLEREFDEQLFFSECKRVLKKDGFIVLFGRGKSFYRWNVLLDELGFDFKEEIVWDKSYASSPVLPISRVHETISIHSIKGVLKRVKVPYTEQKGLNINSVINDVKRLQSALKNEKSFNLLIDYLDSGIRNDFEVKRDSKYNATLQTDKTGVQFVSTMQSIKEGMKEKSIIKVIRDHYGTIHPTQKPVRLLERLLNLTTEKEDVVLDAFSGSGSTALACWNIGRKFIGYEIDKEYFNDSVLRIKKETSSPKLFR